MFATVVQEVRTSAQITAHTPETMPQRITIPYALRGAEAVRRRPAHACGETRSDAAWCEQTGAYAAIC